MAFNLVRPGIFFTFLLAICAAFIACEDGPSHRDRKLPPPVQFDLDSIIARGKIILLTENSASTYYLYRGQGRGFDFELVKDFARSLGVKVEIRLLDDVDQMFEMLNKGEGDLIASNLTITEDRNRIVKFSTPLYTSREVLVQRLVVPDTANYSHITDTAQLSEVPIWVHRYSSFYTTLKRIDDRSKKPLHILEAPGQISTDDLIRLTASGELAATVTDENLARIQQIDYPELDMSVALSGEENIAWAVRTNSHHLQEALNVWLASEKVKRKVDKTYNKYFGDEKLKDYRGPYILPNLSENQISVYDSLFKAYAPQINWDWRLLAALVYQESRFNPEAVSWSGAFGLMQLMPETAKKLGCDSGQTTEPNIRAGVKYLQYLDRMWKDKVHNPEERLKFVLASYNIGPGHIFDARNIAQEMGLKDTIWDGHVAECLLLKSQEKYYTMGCVKHGYCNSKEPFHFVGKILAVYDHYKKNITSP